jgi:hypothetical protein
VTTVEARPRLNWRWNWCREGPGKPRTANLFGVANGPSGWGALSALLMLHACFFLGLKPQALMKRAIRRSNPEGPMLCSASTALVIHCVRDPTNRNEAPDFTDTTDHEEVAATVMLTCKVNAFTCPTCSVSVSIREIRGSHFSF